MLNPLWGLALTDAHWHLGVSMHEKNAKTLQARRSEFCGAWIVFGKFCGAGQIGAVSLTPLYDNDYHKLDLT